MTLEGKGFYIWKLKNCDGADASAITAAAKQADFSHVLIKVADGTRTYNYDSATNVDLVPPVVQSLHANGVQVWGWQYIYGDDPLGEARRAVQRITQLGLDGFVVNAEVEFKESGKDVAARKYMQELRNALPDFPIGLSTYRYPSYHPQFPYTAFLDKCDLNLPQVYWMGAHNPEAQLTKSLREYQNIQPFCPIVPTGYAFAESGYDPPTKSEINRFMDTAKALKMGGVNFWSWDYARNKLPNIWNAIAEYPWPSTPAAKDVTQRYIEALNTHDPVAVTVLYAPLAVHVNSQRTVQGYEAILGWYNHLYNNVLPNGSFEITGFSGSGNSRHMTWTATSPTWRVLNGNDTFGLKDGRIAYHYTFFTKV
ncbi:MAG: nuclear transport factor 2 family protein [Anaerolineales bacterium]|nr:nuclear transport factor 2 family protein [Anaerolineales bacterium]